MPISTRFGALALSLTAMCAAINTTVVTAWADNGVARTHLSSGTSGTSGLVSEPQPYSTADRTNTGANTTSSANPYRSTRDGVASLNGSGTGKATGKPCAGCVGKADNKYPSGQAPNGTDLNAGYECDTNHGIGRTNPAHTGCTRTSTGSSPPPAGGSTPPTGSSSGGVTGCVPGVPAGNSCSQTSPCTSGAGCAVALQGQPGALVRSELPSQAAPGLPQPDTSGAGGASSTARLAFTGGDWSRLVAIGGGLVAFGLILTLLAQRSRRSVALGSRRC